MRDKKDETPDGTTMRSDLEKAWEGNKDTMAALKDTDEYKKLFGDAGSK